MSKVILKNYTDDRINKEIKKMLEFAVMDDEWNDRFECGEDFNILTKNIDMILEYVNNNYEGKLYLNSNIWYICYDCLVKILRLYGLDLIGEEKVTENEEVIFNDNRRN